eukprot:2874854-Lingulodinium_polyedra.AAC.1
MQLRTKAAGDGRMAAGDLGQRGVDQVHSPRSGQAPVGLGKGAQYCHRRQLAAQMRGEHQQ